MPLSEIQRTDVVTIAPEAGVREAAELLEKNNVGSLVVVEDGRPVGLLTDRDIALKIVARGEPLDTTVEGLMSTPVHTVQQGVSLIEAVDTMAEHAIRRLPVVDEGGKLSGLIALDDVLSLMVVEFGLLEGVLLAQSKVGTQHLEHL